MILSPHSKKAFGSLADLPDQRDRHLAFTQIPPSLFPSSADISGLPAWPAIWDQGQLGKCTAMGSDRAVVFITGFLGKTNYAGIEPGHTFTYYNSRVFMGSESWDSGAQVRDAIKAVAKYGIVSSAEWPDDNAQFTAQPTPQAYAAASQEKALLYGRVNPNQMRGTLAHNHPIIIGISVYESFDTQQTAQTGIIPMPGPNEGRIGGHCMAVCGYRDDTRMFKVANSWGAWGDNGYAYLPYDYLWNSDLASDFWVITVTN